MEQLKTEREQLGNSELDLQKALTEKEKQTRRKKELNGLIAEIRRFQGLYDKTKSSRKSISLLAEMHSSRENIISRYSIFFWMRRQAFWPGSLRMKCPVLCVGP